MKPCPINFGNIPYPCAFRQSGDCIYNDEPCIPIHMKKYRKATADYATLKCIACGHETTLTEQETTTFQHALWICGACGLEQEPTPNVIKSKDAILFICSTQCPHLTQCDAHITGGTYKHRENPCLLRTEANS